MDQVTKRLVFVSASAGTGVLAAGITWLSANGNASQSLKSADYGSALVASGVILFLGALHFYLIGTWRERRDLGPWTRAVDILILLLLIVSIVTGIRFLATPHIAAGLILLVCVGYLALPIAFIAASVISRYRRT
jgi:hypothetical protein